MAEDAGSPAEELARLRESERRLRETVKSLETLRAREDQIIQAQKLESVGRLAGGVAHDFNNLLTTILGCAEFLKQDLKDGCPKPEDVEEILEGARRAAALTRQLLAFSRRQVLDPRVLSLNELVENLQKMLRRLIGEDVEVSFSLDPALASVKADPGQLEQVVLNLVVNARDAMPEGGRLLIETANAQLDAAYAEKNPWAAPGRYAMLAVSDTGSGMTPEVRQRLFEPFFTTKEAGKGTGLGLSTAYGIVKQSGGHIACYTEVGRGTTFKVYLPALGGAGAPAEASQEARPRGGSETVLLVEDEERVRAVARRALLQGGYSVLEAASGEEAERIAAEEEPDLLLTDVVLGGIDGVELVRRLRARRPGLRVLLMSGYTERAALRQQALEPGTPFLQKPFTPDALARKVRETLDA